jgi:hypothetical protein
MMSEGARIYGIVGGIAAVVGGLCGALSGHPYIGSAAILLGVLVCMVASQSGQKSR